MHMQRDYTDTRVTDPVRSPCQSPVDYGITEITPHYQQIQSLQSLQRAEVGHYSKEEKKKKHDVLTYSCLLYTSPSPRDKPRSRMPSSA